MNESERSGGPLRIYFQPTCAPDAIDLQVDYVDVRLQVFRLLGVPNATPLQKPQAWSLRFPCTVSMCAFRVLFVPKAAPGQ